jgi:hypothetical protein
MRKIPLMSLAVAAAFVVSACGDDAGGVGTNSGDTPTAAEQEVILEILGEIGAVPFVGAFLAPEAAGPQTAPPINENYSYSASCTEGGSVNVSGKYTGDIDQTALTGTISFDITQQVNGCAEKDDGGTVTVTVDTSPDIVISGDITLNGSTAAPSGSLSWMGGISWTSTDGNSGSCGIDVTVYLGTGNVSGMVCGESVTT